MARDTVSEEEFIKVFQGSDSQTAVARKLKLTPQAVSARAAKMRKRGIPLRRYSIGGGPLRTPGRTKDLAELARKLDK